jgi:hypothetical protein
VVWEVVIREAGKLAKLVELTMTYHVKGIRYGEVVSNMFISDVKFLNMEHIDVKYLMDRVVEKGGNFPAKVDSESPGFEAVEGCIDWHSQEHLSLGVWVHSQVPEVL